MAEHADACNLSGDLKTIRHKLDVLEPHCEAVARDPSEITKTRLGTLVIAENSVEAERAGAAVRAARGMDEDLFRRLVVTGDPDQVRDQARAYLDVGVDGLVFNLPDSHRLEPVRLAGEALAKAFD